MTPSTTAPRAPCAAPPAPRRRRVLTTAALVLLSGGCALTPPPAAPLPADVVAAPAPPEPPPAPPAPSAWERFVDSIEPPSSGGVPLTVIRGSQSTLLIRVSGNTLFDKNSLPSVAFSRWLDRLSQAAAATPDVTLYIEGHTDTGGAAAANLALSKRRAQAVAKRLTTTGLAPARVRWDGQGSAIPVASNDNEAGRATNRRIDIVVTRETPGSLSPFSSSTPTGTAAKPAVTAKPSTSRLKKP